MSRRYRRRGRRPKPLQIIGSAIGAAGLAYVILTLATNIAANAAAMAGAFTAGIVVGHSLPVVRVIWRRR